MTVPVFSLLEERANVLDHKNDYEGIKKLFNQTYNDAENPLEAVFVCMYAAAFYKRKYSRRAGKTDERYFYKRAKKIYRKNIGFCDTRKVYFILRIFELAENNIIFDLAEILWHYARIESSNESLEYSMQNDTEREKIATKAFNLGQLYLQEDTIEKAIELFEFSLDMEDSRIQNNYPETAELITTLTNLYVKTGRMDDARKLAERTLSEQEREISAECPSPIVPDNLCSLAKNYAYFDQYSCAEALYRAALAIYEANPQTNTLQIRTNVAQSLEEVCRKRLETRSIWQQLLYKFQPKNILMRREKIA